MNSRDLAEDAQLAGSGFFVHLAAPRGRHQAPPRRPVAMSDTPCPVRRAAPCLGEHTDDVLTRVVGYPAERIAALREAGVLG